MKVLSLLLALTAMTSLPAQQFENPGFENQTAGWIVSEKTPMSSVHADAAEEGKFGLRVTDESGELGSSAQSSRVAVEPGAPIELSFSARTSSPGFIGVYLWFYDASGKLIKEENLKAGQGHPVIGVKNADGQWHQYTLKATAPEGAASVSLWVHSFGKATGTADFDNFKIEGTKEGAITTVAASPATPPSLPAREKPPVIILKVDDLRQIDGKVHPLWKKLTDYLKARNIKSSIGMLTETLSDSTPEYVNWIKDKQASGDVEFWFHGWDHGVHEVDGTKFNEFKNRSYEEQKKRFEDGQAAARDRLGFPFVTFGPPGGATNGSFDENTIRVMADVPEMKVWLYPQPLDDAGKKLAEQGKVIILDRVWAVNLESKVGQPDFPKFLEGYAKNPDREYFVLQGHPTHWGDPARFEQFTKIIDFLVEQKAVFMTPSEFAALKGAKL